MQQPLCHLYFLTVMEHLCTEQHIPILVQLPVDIQKKLEPGTVEETEALLLWVEYQAVVQVLIQQLALHFIPSQTHKLSDVQLVVEDINKLGQRLCGV